MKFQNKKSIKKLMLGVVLGLGMFTSVHSAEVGVEKPLMPHCVSSLSSYNYLPSPEEADAALQANGNLQSFLSDARKVAEKYNLDDDFGVRLIHRHFTVENGKRMVEFYRTEPSGQQALVTRPEKAEFSKDALPASWVKTQNGYEAFEYSKDAEVQRLSSQVPVNMLEELFALSQQYGLEKLLAPSILKRQWFDRFEGETTFLEESYLNPSESIVMPTKEPLEKETFIITAWFFSLQPKSCVCVPHFICHIEWNPCTKETTHRNCCDGHSHH